MSAVSVLFNDVLGWLFSNFLGLFAKGLAIAFGGVHSPSYLAAFAGFFLQWYLLLLLVALAGWGVMTLRRPNSAS